MRVAPFALRPRPSRLALGVIALLHALPVAAVYAYLPQFWPMLLVFVPLSLTLMLRSEGFLQNADRPEVLTVSPAGELWLEYPTYNVAVRVRPDTTVWSWLCVLRVEMPGGAVRNLTLWPDSADAEALRALRVFLRFGPEATEPTAE